MKPIVREKYVSDSNICKFLVLDDYSAIYIFTLNQTLRYTYEDYGDYKIIKAAYAFSHIDTALEKYNEIDPKVDNFFFEFNDVKYTKLEKPEDEPLVSPSWIYAYNKVNLNVKFTNSADLLVRSAITLDIALNLVQFRDLKVTIN